MALEALERFGRFVAGLQGVGLFDLFHDGGGEGFGCFFGGEFFFVETEREGGVDPDEKFVEGFGGAGCGFGGVGTDGLFDGVEQLVAGVVGLQSVGAAS